MWWFAFYMLGGASGGGSSSNPCAISATVGGHNIAATITSDSHTIVVPSTLTGYIAKC